jgi:predicted ribosomally synthesized peptide with nif11-like leader
MKTLGEFLQRLEDDAAFEDKAQAFNQGDELMAFVKSMGYDFTLEELTTAFKQSAKSTPEAGDPAPAPPVLSASTPPVSEVAPFPGSPAVFLHDDTSPAPPDNGSADLSLEPSRQEFQELPELQRKIPPETLEEKSPGGLFRGGGGRHRGFPAQRLKSVSGEDS